MGSRLVEYWTGLDRLHAPNLTWSKIPVMDKNKHLYVT